MTGTSLERLAYVADCAMKIGAGWRLLTQRTIPNCNPLDRTRKQPLTLHMIRGATAQVLRGERA